MKFTIITHVTHLQHDGMYYGYAPYIREMNIWLKYVEEVTVVAPIENQEKTAIDLAYHHKAIDFRTIPNFNFLNIKNIILAVLKLPKISWTIFCAMKKADHIHLRCPGNVGLIGCFVQILFPKKIKTAKYAGNWDPKAKQPWAYRLQKYILNNTFLTRNMQVLVYGQWEKQSKNIIPFFTASYADAEKEIIQKPDFSDGIQFIFVGNLSSGKNPLYAMELVQKLMKRSFKIKLNIYGEGSERIVLEKYIVENQLENYIFLQGNCDKETLKTAYKKSHFVILPSQSEGWPKAIAEGMFWGCVPVATPVSCVPYMLDSGNRGILLNRNLEQDTSRIALILSDEVQYNDMSIRAVDWSQQYTTDLFEAEIQKILKS
jgi:glycosyltransferase involved in cell wall biosynthesis